MARRVKYLNNKDMLAEIHKSKISYSSFLDPQYAYYDIIVPSVEKLTETALLKQNATKQNVLVKQHTKLLKPKANV